MDCIHSRSGRPSILALVYSDGSAARRVFSDLGYRLRDCGLMVAGLVPYHASAREDAPRCDMEVEELSSTFIIELAEPQDRQDCERGVDPAAVQEAAALIAASFRKGPDLLLINKFGLLEAAGGGLTEVISDAVDARIPVIVGVPERHLAAWREFTGGLAEEAAVDSPRLQHWLGRRGLVPQRTRPGVEAVLTSAA